VGVAQKISWSELIRNQPTEFGPQKFRKKISAIQNHRIPAASAIATNTAARTLMSDGSPNLFATTAHDHSPEWSVGFIFGNDGHGAVVATPFLELVLEQEAIADVTAGKYPAAGS